MVKTTDELIDDLTLWSGIDKLQEVLDRINEGGSVVSPNHVIFSSLAQTTQVELRAEGLNWGIGSDEDSFVTVSPTSGYGNATLTVTIEENTLPVSRRLWSFSVATDNGISFFNVLQKYAE